MNSRCPYCKWYEVSFSPVTDIEVVSCFLCYDDSICDGEECPEYKEE